MMSLMTSALLLQWSELSPYFIWLNNNIWHCWSFSLLERIYMAFCIPSVLVFLPYYGLLFSISFIGSSFPHGSLNTAVPLVSVLGPFLCSIYIHLFVILSHIMVVYLMTPKIYISFLDYVTQPTVYSTFPQGCLIGKSILKFETTVSTLAFKKNREVVKMN